MRKNYILNKETHNSFFDILKRDDLSNSDFKDWMNELQKDLSSFWEKMNK